MKCGCWAKGEKWRCEWGEEESQNYREHRWGEGRLDDDERVKPGWLLFAEARSGSKSVTGIAWRSSLSSTFFLNSFDPRNSGCTKSSNDFWSSLFANFLSFSDDVKETKNQWEKRSSSRARKDVDAGATDSRMEKEVCPNCRRIPHPSPSILLLGQFLKLTENPPYPLSFFPESSSPSLSQIFMLLSAPTFFANIWFSWLNPDHVLAENRMRRLPTSFFFFTHGWMQCFDPLFVTDC